MRLSRATASGGKHLPRDLPRNLNDAGFVSGHGFSRAVKGFLAFRIQKALPEESGGEQPPTRLRKKISWANSERIRLEAELKELKAKSVPTLLAPEGKYSRSEIGDMPADLLLKKMDTERGFKEQLEEAAQPARPKEEG